jgi:predicted O-methyltransferase YrrM
MNERIAQRVDDYFAGLFVGDDVELQGVIASCERAGLPPIAVSPVQGKLLNLLVRMNGARRVLEVGTLGGYSAIWMARALPAGGRLITLEIDEHHANVARANVNAAGVGDLVKIRVGAALETLSNMSGEAPFDLIFIDADKRNNPRYIDYALRYSHVGSVILVDNVVRDGAVLDEHSSDPDVRGTRELLRELATNPRLYGTALQTVGHKGYDGFAIAVVVA